MHAIAQAPERIAELLAALSHDLRAPLSAILLWERVLRDQVEDVQMRERALDAIRDSAAAQSSLIGELVHIASLLGGTTDLARDPVAIGPVVRAAITSVLVDASAKDIDVELACRGGLGDVVGDRQALQRALDHVLAAAVHRSHARRPLSVSARRTRDCVELAIGQQPRGHRAPHGQRGAWTELRLIIARELIALHGGVLDCTQHADNTVFSVALPRANEER